MAFLMVDFDFPQFSHQLAPAFPQFPKISHVRWALGPLRRQKQDEVEMGLARPDRVAAAGSRNAVGKGWQGGGDAWHPLCFQGGSASLVFFLGLLMVVGSSAVFWVKIVGLRVKISPFG